jgi:hypothetical protein
VKNRRDKDRWDGEGDVHPANAKTRSADCVGGGSGPP